MMKMTLTATTARELSNAAEKRFYEGAYGEAVRLVEGYISRTIKKGCDKGACGVDFKFPQEDKLIWNQVRIILCNNGYKTNVTPGESPILSVRW